MASLRISFRSVAGRTAAGWMAFAVAAIGCDPWSAYRMADSTNCVLIDQVCSADQSCNLDTEHCEAVDPLQRVLRLDTISPPTGPNGGGIPVTLVGSGLLAPLTVTFDGIPATVQGADGKNADVLLPSAPGRTGLIPVRVVRGNQQVQRDDLFSYHTGNASFGAGANGSTRTALSQQPYSLDVADV